MEYTKVQTALNHVKDVIIAKIDKVDVSVTSVKNSVTNLPATLDSKFSALTTKVDGIKTDVAGVGSKVDEVKNDVSNVDTNVTDVGGKVDGVKADVAKTAKSTELAPLAKQDTLNTVGVSVAEARDEVLKLYKLGANPNSKQFYSQNGIVPEKTKKTVFEISGAGTLNRFMINKFLPDNSNGNQILIVVDDVTVATFLNSGEYISIKVDLIAYNSQFIPNWNATTSTVAAVLPYFRTGSEIPENDNLVPGFIQEADWFLFENPTLQKSNGKIDYGKRTTRRDHVYRTDSPVPSDTIEFSHSLKVILDNKTTSSVSYSELYVYYTLYE